MVEKSVENYIDQVLEPNMIYEFLNLPIRIVPLQRLLYVDKQRHLMLEHKLRRTRRQQVGQRT